MMMNEPFYARSCDKDNSVNTRIRKSQKILPALEPEEIHRLFTQAKKESTKDKWKYRSFVVIKCLIYFGLRRAELSNLKIGHIDFPNKRILVYQGKGKKDRYIGFYELNLDDTSIEDTLREYIGNRTEGYFIQGKDSEGRVSTTEIYRIVVGLAKRSGILKDTAPHTLRRSLATFLYSIGTPEIVIKNILGHTQLETTMRYVKNTIERDSKEIDKTLRINQLRADYKELKMKATTPEAKIDYMIHLLEAFLGLD